MFRYLGRVAETKTFRRDREKLKELQTDKQDIQGVPRGMDNTSGECFLC